MSYFQGLVHSERLLISSGALWRSMINIRTPDAGKRSSKIWVDEHDDQFDSARYAFSDIIKSGETPLKQSMQAMNWWAP